jgi:hypothetical protein
LPAILVCYTALAAIGVVEWVRTGPLRRGRGGGDLRREAIPSPAREATSVATYLPAATGMAVMAMGGSVAASSAPAVAALALALSGATVASLGLLGRVTEMRAGWEGLTILYAGRSAFSMAWAQCEQVRGPRWPLGGWRIRRADGAARTLMPSDLLGREWFIRAAIHGAGLHFDGRDWRRRDPLSSDWRSA